MTAIRIRLLSVALALLVAVGVAAQTPPRRALQAVVEAGLATFPARTGIYVKHLGTGEEATVRADQAFSSASVIKLTFLVRAYELADRGELNLDERVTVGREQWRPGTGILQYHDPGGAVTWRDLLTEMVITSDNTATDLVLQRVGGVAVVNAWLAERGYAALRSNGRPHEYRRALLALVDPRFTALTAEETTGLLYAMDGNVLFERYRDLFVGPRAAWVATVTDVENKRRFGQLRDEKTANDPAFWLGSMTPRDTARLLEAIQRDTAASPKACAEMREALRRQQLGARRLPHFVTVPVAHKTGDASRIANDVGIVYARSGPVVVAFFANAVTGSYGEAEDRIGRIAEAIVQAVDARP